MNFGELFCFVEKSKKCQKNVSASTVVNSMSILKAGVIALMIASTPAKILFREKSKTYLINSILLIISLKNVLKNPSHTEKKSFFS